MTFRLRRGATLLVATTNPGKLREIQSLLAGVPLEIRALPPENGLDAPDETGATFEENARLKAQYYANATGLLTVAEDSGLAIDALDGAPGIFSARYPGATYDERFKNLFTELDARGATTPAQRTARFVCALALAQHAEDAHSEGRAQSDIVFETRGTVEGVIADAPRGVHGFGYDPIFFYPPYGCTLGEVADDRKALVSHRGVAFRALRAFLEQHIV